MQGNNPLAIASLVVSIVGVIACCSVVISVVGVVLGFIGMNQIKASGQRGEGLAKAGIIIGIVGVAIGIIYWILYVVGAVHYGFGTYNY